MLSAASYDSIDIYKSANVKVATQGAAAPEILAQGAGIPIFLSDEAFCPDEESLINPSAKSLGGLWRSWRISEKIQLSGQIALERSSTVDPRGLRRKTRTKTEVLGVQETTGHGGPGAGWTPLHIWWMVGGPRGQGAILPALELLWGFLCFPVAMLVAILVSRWPSWQAGLTTI
jgi:hypothetical protein